MAFIDGKTFCCKPKWSDPATAGKCNFQFESLGDLFILMSVEIGIFFLTIEIGSRLVVGNQIIQKRYSSKCNGCNQMLIGISHYLRSADECQLAIRRKFSEIDWTKQLNSSSTRAHYQRKINIWYITLLMCCLQSYPRIRTNLLRSFGYFLISSFKSVWRSLSAECLSIRYMQARRPIAAV